MERINYFTVVIYQEIKKRVRKRNPVIGILKMCIQLYCLRQVHLSYIDLGTDIFTTLSRPQIVEQK